MEIEVCENSERYLSKYSMAYDTYDDILYMFCLFGSPIPLYGFMPQLVRFLEKKGYVVTLDTKEGIFIKPFFEIQDDTIKFCRNNCIRSDCVCCKNMHLG
jgi:hypothetical protein